MTTDRKDERFVYYDPDEGTYHCQYDWTSPGTLAVDVLEIYAAITGEPIETLPPLPEAIDPNALNDLFTPSPSRETPRQGVSVTFAYGEFEITIHGDGEIILNPIDVRGGVRPNRTASHH